MLPFLKPKQVGAVMIAKRKASGSIEDMHEEGDHHPGLQAAAEDLIKAVHSKNVDSVAQALTDAFQIIDAEPHEEGDHDIDNFLSEDET